MSDAPLISVIVPTYNRAGYICAAIDSVFSQTLQDFEIIVVDDGSTDDTEQRLAAAYGDRVKYVRVPNGGVGRARNVGMSHARGRYFTFLDSDDLLYPYMLELESRMLDMNPDVDLVYAEMSAFDDDSYFDKYHLKSYHYSAYRDPQVTYDRIFERSTALGDVAPVRDLLAAAEPALLDRRVYFGNIFDEYLVNIVVFQNNMMMRREVVGDVGGRNPRMRFYEELDYILRISRRHRVGFIDVPTYKLRYHANQLSTTAGSNGRRIWMLKQKELLRVVRRQAFADRTYYQQHRDRVDRHLASLNRSVAVPMLLCAGGSGRSRTYARRARKYLDQCARLGHPHRALWCLTFAPDAVRSFGISLIEYGRGLSHRWISRKTVHQT